MVGPHRDLALYGCSALLQWIRSAGGPQTPTHEIAQNVLTTLNYYVDPTASFR